MLWLKRFIFTFPVLVILFFVAAFLLVKAGPVPRENILIRGSIGEPENVNPIRATTTSASDVTSLVFNGLVGIDEQFKLIPELATGWRLDQSCRLFFDTPADAEAVEAALKAVAKDIHLAKLDRADKELSLQFDNAAGLEFLDAVEPALKDHPARDVWLVTVSPRPGKKFPDGGELAPEEMEKRVRQALQAAGADAVILQTYTLLGEDLELVGHGPRAAVEKIVNDLFQPDAGKAALASVGYEVFKAHAKPVYTFTLRKGVRWHAGKLGGQDFPATEFTAEDVQFTYEMLVSTKVLSPRASDYLNIESCEVVDPHTIRFVYKKPYSVALNSWMMNILPKHVLADKSIGWWSEHFDRAPLGTGPFKFDFWRKGEMLRLVRNDDYFQGRPNLDAIYIRYIPDQTNINLALETRGIDFYSVEPHAVDRFKREQGKRFELFQFLARGYNYIGWNLNRPLFQDVRVRRALAHAVNIDEIIRYKMYGHAQQSLGIFTPHFWFANPNVQPLEYDPKKASELLAEAGWEKKDSEGYLINKDGKRFEFTLITNTANEIRRDIGVIVQANLKKVGIKVNPELYEWTVFIQRHINRLDFDACILGWSVGVDYDMYQLWHSSQAKPGGLNHCSYKNKRVDELLERIRVTFDQDKLRQMTWELQQIIYDDQPYLFLFVSEATVAIHKGAFRVYRPTDTGEWVEEPIRRVPAGMGLYMPFWYRTDHKPAALTGDRK